MKEERLDPDYFRTTPKSSWELFKWIFTEPIKLKDLPSSLSLKESIIWFLKLYVYIAILTCIIFIFITIFYSNFSFFKDIMNLSWNEYISILGKILIIFFIQILIISLLFVASGGEFLVSLMFSFAVISKADLIFSLIITLVIAFVYSLSVGLSFVLQVGLILVFFFTVANEFLYGLIIAFIFVVSYYFILFGLHSYLYYFIKNQIFNNNLMKNSYLQNGYIFFPIYGLKKKLANNTFSNYILACNFIQFLFEFRPYQRELAFYLSNVLNASKLYHNKLESNSIKISKEYEKNQPTENFTNTLQKLKDELEKYQVQNNIHHQIASLKKIIEILKDLEQQMLIEKRGWSEYYLKAIRANFDEANARLKNYELEAKNREPITPNIYEIGSPLSPNYQNQLFKGRKEVVDRLSNIIYTSQQMPLLLIQGQRRVGKTSLINYLEQLLGSGFKIVKLDMQSATNKRFNSLVKNINEELHSMLGIEETIETTDDILESWIAFESYLTKHTKALNYKIIIAFDEYEAFHKHIIKKNSDGEDILESMRSFMQSQNQVIFLFSGMLRLSDLTAPNWDEYFPQAQRLKVDYLSKEESYELITNPVEDFNLVYTDAVTDEVYKLTMGHPQLLQTICSIIVTLANETNQKNVTPEMVANAKEQVFEVNEMPMTIFWREFCGNEEREVMEQILAHHEVQRETQEQKRAVARLVDYGFITKEFDIFVPLFEKWLVERRDLIEI